YASSRSSLSDALLAPVLMKSQPKPRITMAQAAAAAICHGCLMPLPIPLNREPIPAKGEPRLTARRVPGRRLTEIIVRSSSRCRPEGEPDREHQQRGDFVHRMAVEGVGRHVEPLDRVRGGHRHLEAIAKHAGEPRDARAAAGEIDARELR